MKLMKKILNFSKFVLEKITHTKPMSIPEDVKKISKLFTAAGKDLFIVGGAVRDFIQGKIPHDYDLVTNAQPDESKQILKGWNVSDEQGKNFGVLRIYTKDEPLGYELAAYRKDISKGRDTKGEDQKVEIGSHITIEDDVKRRDLTCNALFYDINKKEIVDLVGGIEDIKNNNIRCVGDPKQRFDEDRLRILRVFRFAARTGGEIDPQTAEAIRDDNRLRGISATDDVSQERILEEWNKMRGHAKDDLDMMQNYIELLFDFEMFEQMFPGLDHSEVLVTCIDNAILFYDLFYDNMASKLRTELKKLKFPLELIGEIDFCREIEWKWNDVENVYDLAKKKKRGNIPNELVELLCFHIEMGGRFGIDTFKKPIGGKQFDMPGEPLEKEWVEAFLKYCDDGFKVDGNDLLSQGFNGKAIEIEKERLEIERFKTEYLHE